jgi:PKD repeat protein
MLCVSFLISAALPSLAPLSFQTESSHIVQTTGAYTVGYGACPTPITTYSCPSTDTAGNAYYGGTVDGTTLVCLYGNSGYPDYTDATACNYEVVRDLLFFLGMAGVLTRGGCRTLGLILLGMGRARCCLAEGIGLKYWLRKKRGSAT